MTNKIILCQNNLVFDIYKNDMSFSDSKNDNCQNYAKFDI